MTLVCNWRVVIEWRTLLFIGFQNQILVLHSTFVNPPCFASKTRVSGAKHIWNVSKTFPCLNMRIHCTIGWLANRSSIHAKTLAQKPKLDLDTVTNSVFGVWPAERFKHAIEHWDWPMNGQKVKCCFKIVTSASFSRLFNETMSSVANFKHWIHKTL